MTSSGANLNSEFPARSWEMYSPASKSASHRRPSTALTVESPKGTGTVPAASSSKRELTLVLLGEAPGAEEETRGEPFVGASGHLLRNTILPSAGLEFENFHVLNVFTQRPPNNDLDQWTANKTSLKKMGLSPKGNPLRKRYLLPEYHWHLAELDRRLEELKPDLIVCLGGVALWALTGEAAISNYRGNFFTSRFGCPAIATFHPAALLRQWGNLPYTWADLKKVRLWLDNALPAPLTRTFCINPTFGEISIVYSKFRMNPSWLLGVDIETYPKLDQLTTISFSTPTYGLCIPVWNKDARTPEQLNYWKTAAEEYQAWLWIKRFAELPNPKVAQNGMYDMTYLLDGPLGIRLLNLRDDTAILQHASQPELQKALGTLSSLYLNEPSWKFMRMADKDQNKADE